MNRPHVQQAPPSVGTPGSQEKRGRTPGRSSPFTVHSVSLLPIRVECRWLGDLVQRVFRGSREQLLSRLLENHRLNAKERAALEAILRGGKR